MGARLWLNAALLAAVGLLVALWLVSPGIDEATLPPLTDVDVAALSELRVEAPGRVPAVLRRDGGGWRLAAPVDSAADADQVERVLTLFTTLSAQQYDLAGQDLAAFGLDVPSALLSGGGVTLAFGKLDPLNYRRYVRLGDTLHLIQYADISMLTAGWPLFVEHRLLTPEHEVAALILPDRRLQRGSDGAWRVEGAALPDGIDGAAVAAAWREVRAAAVRLWSGQATGRFVVVEYAGEVAPLRFAVISEDDGLVLGRSDLGVEYHFTAAQAQRLLGRSETIVDADHGHGPH